MKNAINYNTSSIPGKSGAIDKTTQVSNSEILVDIMSLLLVLFARLEHPKNAKSMPIITSVPQLLESITKEKKLAIMNLAQSRSDVICEFNDRMKEMYFTYFDKLEFKTQEKELAWLLLKANSTKECVEKMHTSESQFRYSIKKMCQKTKTDSKDSLITKLRTEVECY